jgi:hypothetical protein
MQRRQSFWAAHRRTLALHGNGFLASNGEARCSSHSLFRCFTAVLILMAAAGGAFAQGNAVAVQQQVFDALARGDVGDALALFTDDAVIDAESGLCWKTPCVGNAAIQKDLERLVSDKSHRITPLNTYVSGNVLVTRLEARSA